MTFTSTTSIDTITDVVIGMLKKQNLISKISR